MDNKKLQVEVYSKEGDIIEKETGLKLGRHIGCMYYTIGQRKGLGIGGIAGHKSGSYYVCDKDVKKNILYVTQEDEEGVLFKDHVIVKDVNFLREKNFDWVKMQAKFRYRQPDIEISMRFIDEATVEIKCDNKVRAITVGQIAVFYDNGEMIGGGTIDQVD